jgi:hypothetical protein
MTSSKIIIKTTTITLTSASIAWIKSTSSITWKSASLNENISDS